MQMHHGFIEEALGNTVSLQIRHDVAVGDLGRFLHYITEFSGEAKAAVERVHARALHGQGRPTHGRPRQPGDDADTALRRLGAKQRHAEKILYLRLADTQLQLRIVEQSYRRLAHDTTELFLQVANPGLAGNPLDDGANRRVANFQTRFRNAGALEQARPQMVLGNLQLLFGDVTGEADHLHTVDQRPGDRVELIG